MRVGFGYDSHRLVKDRKLYLGGVEVLYNKGLLGHSDADVLLHAICDAILGAISSGDLGFHFPDSDMQYKGISSLLLLQKTKEIAAKKGFRIHNVDSTVVLEEPKLRAYIKEMVSNIAKTLDVSGEMINIKATTNEGMGFTGKGEGIAAFAVVTVEKKAEDKQ